ncbi:MAG TPA: Gfo/Idh/MocA family oxidoreductase, partial [Prosthecobacter sp.]|nr:Gfo/Idh/MocA family oxidoreductase [Prosthecobacter sp.]
KTGALDLGPVTTRRARFADAVSVYDELMRAGNGDVGVVLEYGGAATPADSVQLSASSAPKEHPPAAVSKPVDSLHVIGAGNFARTMLLPHLKGNIVLGTIVNATGLSARHVKEKFGFAEAETDAAAVWKQNGTSAVMIGTRHHLHAPLVLKGLQAGKHVFVEKPLCLTPEELREIDDAMAATKGSVMVGFNRRFAPAALALKEAMATVPGPKTLAYHVFAGPLAPDHWYANLEESGGRVLGEACHFLDLACFLLGSAPVQVTAQTVGRPLFPDSVTAQIAFADGSSAQIIYSADGDFSFPKETFRVFGSGMVAECENFQTLTLYHKRNRSVKKFSGKGHAEEMAAWLAFLKGAAPHPLPFAAARQSMGLSFATLASIREGCSVKL